MQEMFQNAGQASPEDRQKMGVKIQEMQTKAVNDILDTTQQKRYKELDLQRAGAQAVARPDVAKELVITDEQKKKLEDIQKASQEEMRALFTGGGGGGRPGPEVMEKIQAQQKASGEKMMAVLTAEQSAKHTQLTNEVTQLEIAARGFHDRVDSELDARQSTWMQSHRATVLSDWQVAQVLAARSTGGAELQSLDDHSWLVSGKTPDQDVYEVQLKAGQGEVSALRLD